MKTELRHIHTAEGLAREMDLVLSFEDSLRVPSFPNENEREPLGKILGRVRDPDARPRSGFVQMLDYKGEWYGVNVLRAGRFDPTSQTCSVCGFRNTGTKDLSVRGWTCPECGTHHDRDLNAAVNIMDAAIKRYFNEQSPAVTGITDADGADSENNAGIGSPVCDYASDETSMPECG